MKTIKQIADELGVSKQAVQKRIAREPLYTSLCPCLSTIKGTKYIDEIGEHLIKSAFRENQPATVADNVHTVNVDSVHALIAMLQQELDTKTQLLEKQQSTISELTSALENTTVALREAQATAHAAQALHAGTMQQQLADGYADPAPGFFSRIFRRGRL